MSTSDKDLHDLTKPDIDVPIFQQNLRRNLLRTAPQPETLRPSWFAMGLAGFSAGAFGMLLILFVVNPQVPARINQWATGHDEAALAASTTPVPTSNFELPGTQDQGAYRVVNNSILADSRLTSEADRAFIEHQMQQEHPNAPRPRIVSVKEEGVLSVRRYTTADGREMVVYTRIVDDNTETEDTIF